jgi:hypothetical protein
MDLVGTAQAAGASRGRNPRSTDRTADVDDRRPAIIFSTSDLTLDSGFVDQHNRDIIAYWINKRAVCVRAFQRGLIVLQRHFRFALRTTEDFQQLRT